MGAVTLDDILAERTGGGALDDTSRAERGVGKYAKFWVFEGRGLERQWFIPWTSKRRHNHWLTLVHIRAQLEQLQDTVRVQLGYTVDKLTKLS